MKIKTKLTFAFLLIYLVTISFTSAFLYSKAHENLTTQILSHLESVVAIQKNRFMHFIEHNIERLSLVSSRTQLRLSLDKYIKEKPLSAQKRMNIILLDARSSINHFEDISVLDLKGEVVASTNKDMIGTNRSNEDFFVLGQKGNNADIFFLDEDQNLKAYLSGPLYLEDRLIGVLVIKSSIRHLTELVRDYSGLGETGETLLAKKDESGNAVFLTPLRFDPSAALKKTISSDAIDKPIIQALLKNESFFEETTDYRGNPVLAATRYIGKTDWGLVAKIDRAEAFRPITQLQYTLAFIILISSIIVVIITLYLARTITGPLNKLTQVTGIISSGDLSQKADITSNDEIGVLAQTFNQMTTSLNKSNSELKQKIIERQRAEEELKGRVKELEEFYEMAVSREIRMKKLKEEINRLNNDILKLKSRQEAS